MIWVSGPMLSSFFFILSIRIYFYNILHPIETISGNHCLCFGFAADSCYLVDLFC
jgi:hypothetical protein